MDSVTEDLERHLSEMEDCEEQLDDSIRAGRIHKDHDNTEYLTRYDDSNLIVITATITQFDIDTSMSNVEIGELMKQQIDLLVKKGFDFTDDEQRLDCKVVAEDYYDYDEWDNNKKGTK